MSLKKATYTSVKKVLNRLPYIKTLHKQSLNCCYPNGHFYSPVFLLEDVKKREFEIWKNIKNESIQGVKLYVDEQKDLVSKFSQFYDELPFKSKSQNRYQLENGYYSFTDGIILYSMMRFFQPKRIIEVGSGFSSMVMLDVNEIFFKNQIDLTFIEPYPDRLYSLMRESDKDLITLIESDVQKIPITTFEKLEKGDFLFIDSTHVSKTGSDVNYILFEILPFLKKGVLIHFHDIFHPFEYPKEWVFNGVNWNECYMLKAFLMYNEMFKIKYFSHYLQSFHKSSFNKMPLCFNNSGSSLWIEKL
jgi:predicted O-methyltransferase YrrM